MGITNKIINNGRFFMAVPFPLSEIYYHVLHEGWKIEELWRKDGEIRIAVYFAPPAFEEMRKKMGLPLEDVIAVTKHLGYSLYEDR